jgi:transposase
VSCRLCETIMQAPLPSFPIERGRPGPGLLAHVVVGKYADGLPLHRQTGIYEREGVDLDRSTMADWVGSTAALLRPLVEAIGQHVRAGPVLHADDTPMKVLAPGHGKTKTGRLWVAVRDERSWSGSAPPAAFYRYSRDRKGENAEALLAGCRGFLHADGYGGFYSLYVSDPKTNLPRLTEVACWSHYLESDFISGSETRYLMCQGNSRETTQDKKQEIKATEGTPRDLAQVSTAWPDQARCRRVSRRFAGRRASS